jgi:hypothetical protein
MSVLKFARSLQQQRRSRLYNASTLAQVGNRLLNTIDGWHDVVNFIRARHSRMPVVFD